MGFCVVQPFLSCLRKWHQPVCHNSIIGDSRDPKWTWILAWAAAGNTESCWTCVDTVCVLCMMIGCHVIVDYWFLYLFGQILVKYFVWLSVLGCFVLPGIYAKSWNNRPFNNMPWSCWLNDKDRSLVFMRWGIRPSIMPDKSQLELLSAPCFNV